MKVIECEICGARFHGFTDEEVLESFNNHNCGWLDREISAILKDIQEGLR